jgi:hypothetical protein
VRVQFLPNPDAEVKDILTLTPALSRRERVLYSCRYRLMPMGLKPRRDLGIQTEARFMDVRFYETGPSGATPKLYSRPADSRYGFGLRSQVRK